jgi:hypothetical protein
VTQFDPYWANVSLLLHMDGSNGSTTFTDSSSSALTITTNGLTGPQISTSQSKFGGAGGLFDGSYDSLSFTSISIGASEDVTIEGWIYPTATSDEGIVGDNSGSNVQILTILGNQLSSYWNGNEISGGIIVANTWQHVAITRESGTIRLFVNGVLGNTSSGNTQPLLIGKIGFAAYRGLYSGFMDEFRVTKGIARYTSNFSPLATPFPNS